MKHDIPAPTGAIDWATASHVGAVVDHDGELVARYDFSHTGEGLSSLLRRFAEHGVTAVAIERPDGPVVESLLDADFEVFVISSRQLKNLRGRYGSAGNKDDALDAFVLADVLRTDRRRLSSLQRDGDLTRALRALTRGRKDLIAARVALGQPAAGEPADRPSRRHRPVPPPRLADLAGVPATVHHRGQGSMVVGETT